jgi:DNA-nicking Smr family endonuclease
MNSDEDELFTEAMTDVVPLKRERRVDIAPKSRNDRDTALEHRRRAASELPQSDQNTLTDTAVRPLDAWYVLAFQRPGVQNGVFRKLKQGRYEAESRLDLHRMTAEIARRAVFEFIEECQQLGLRSVLVIHGKGESKADQERSSILKGCVDHWLRELPIVQAFHSAQPRHGGTGAAYVLLRKSEQAKRENREKFAKGRVPFDEAER